MRYENSVTSISWIPSQAVTGSFRVASDDQLDQIAEHFATRAPRVTVGTEGGTFDL
jgi:hypothetical protein